MTPPDRLGEIEALEKMLEADGALYPTYANKLIAIARRQMERADKAAADLEANARGRLNDRAIMEERAERAEARVAELKRFDRGYYLDKVRVLEKERDAARAETQKLSDANSVLMGEINRLSVELENAQENYRIVNKRWLEADKSDLKARAEADTLTGYLNGAEARADKWKAEADALRAALQDYVDADPMTDSLLAKAKAAIAGPASALDRELETTPSVEPAAARPAKCPASSACAGCPACAPATAESGHRFCMLRLSGIAHGRHWVVVDLDGLEEWCDGLEEGKPAPAPPEACPGLTHCASTVREHCPACPSHKEASR